MSYPEMGKARGLTKFQVNRVLQTLKSGLRKHALDDNEKAYDTKLTKKTGKSVFDWDKPLTEIAKKVESKIKSTLSRPSDGLRGPSGGGKVKKALDTELDDLLGSL